MLYLTVKNVSATIDDNTIIAEHKNELLGIN